MLGFVAPTLPAAGARLLCRPAGAPARAAAPSSFARFGAADAAQAAFGALLVAQLCAARRRSLAASRRRSRSSGVAVAAGGSTTLQKVVKQPGEAEEKIAEGDLVRIHYEGRLEDGSVFDSSVARDEPFEFNLGESEVIDGWDMLIGTMTLGEVADLVIPAEFAYGEAGIPDVVPPGETLTYTVEILDIGRPVEDGEEDDSDDDFYEEEGGSGTKLFWEQDEQREGGRGKGYQWAAVANGAEIEIRVPLKLDVRLKDVKVDIRTFNIKIAIGDKVILDGATFDEVDMDESHYDFEKKGDNLFLVASVAKIDKEERWESLLKGGDMQAERVDAEVVDVDAALRMANQAARKQ